MASHYDKRDAYDYSDTYSTSDDETDSMFLEEDRKIWRTFVPGVGNVGYAATLAMAYKLTKSYSEKARKADDVARELVEEEENEKLRQENKKQRKKKKRQKRKEKKVNDENQNQDAIKCNGSKTDKSDDDTIDINSAFVSKAAEKLANFKKGTVQKCNRDNKTKEHPVTVLALDAFRCATEGKYEEAIKKYTEAVSVSPEDFRLYVNRSLCFLQIQEYQKALQDALDCIRYAPDYSKGFFRKGEAYLGLNNIQLAEEAFEQVLKLDPNCQEATNDLLFIRVKTLMDLGYSKEHASTALRHTRTINDAVEYLLQNPDCGSNVNIEVSEGAQGEDVYNSDEENYESETNWSDASSIISSIAASNHCSIGENPTDPYTDVRNPFKCPDLYVGNIPGQVMEKQLYKTFSRYGTLNNIRMMPSSKSAFITYSSWESASNAMKNLQKQILLPNSTPIIIKYPAAQLARLSGNSLQLNDRNRGMKTARYENISRNNNWCSQTMPPSSPTPSLSSVKSSFSQPGKPRMKIDPLKDPSNPTNCASIYIGNLSKNMKEKYLIQVFSRYGKITSMRLIPESKCAFINFDSGRSAANAMRALQNKSILTGTPPVIIKYPTKAIKPIPSKDCAEVVDCYKWRTLGCPLGNRCPHRHEPDKKGIALSHSKVTSTNKKSQ